MKKFRLFFFSFFSASLFGLIEAPAQAELVIYKLLNGDSVSGELLKEESSKEIKVLNHKYLGRIEIKSSSIDYPKVKYWNTNIEVGLDGSSTKSSNSLGYLLEANTQYKDKFEELNFGGKYDFKKTSKSGEESIVGVNKALTNVRYDRSINNDWTTFVATDYEYNALNKVGVNDVKSYTGLSYKLIKNSKISLRLSAGPSIEWVDGGSKCTREKHCGDLIPGGVFGTDLKWSINRKLAILMDNKYTTQLAYDSPVSNRFSTALRFYPSLNSNLYASLSYENIYDQIKDPSQEHSYKLKIGTTF